MKLLELFSGTESIGKVFRSHGWDVTTVDNDTQHNSTICTDILNYMPNEYFDVIWASPPCQGFSVASIGKMWNKDHTPKHDTARLGLLLLEHTLEIINAVNPKYFFIENPRGKMRRMQMLEGKPRRTVTYCQYGDSRMKPTDIWTNCEAWTPRPMCKNGDSCHISAPRGSKTGTQGLDGSVERSRIPEELCEEIFVALQGDKE